MILSSWSGRSEAAEPANAPADVALDGLPGFFNIGIPYAPSTRLSIAGTGRYGLIESMGPISGKHHELGGSLAVGGVFAKWFSAALMFDGKYQKHPAENTGSSDHSIVGLPILKLRVGAPTGRNLLFGGELDIRFPGGNAPSVELNATTLTARLLATFVSTAPFYVGITAGFRFDNSENGAPEQSTLRPGDRIALDVSVYNAILLGVAMAYELKRVRFIFETDSTFYIAKKAAVAESPIRLTFGARFAATDALQFDLYTETYVNKRPDVDTSAPLLPIQPRFAVLMGLRYTFGVGDKAAPVETTPDWVEPEKHGEADLIAPPPKDIPEAPTGTIQGRILDEEGLPVAEAAVSVVAADGTEYAATTNVNGDYTVQGLPTGPAQITATAEYFEPSSFEVEVTENSIATASPTQLVQKKVGSQIRGLVRDVSGSPLNAHILVKPGRHKVQTDEKGYFEVDVDAGEYSVEISSPGFIRQKRTVSVGDNSVVIMNVDLSTKQ